MKNAKILAAVMAGTMVFAAAAPVFAAGKELDAIYDGWWWKWTDEDGKEHDMEQSDIDKTIADTGDLLEDGTYSYTMVCLPMELGDEQAYVISGDIFDDSDDWISFGTHGDCWNGGNGKSTNSGQNTSVDFIMTAGDAVTVEITRSGADFKINLYKNDSIKCMFSATGSNLTGTIHTRVVAQFGNFTLCDTIEGDGAASFAAAKDAIAAAKSSTATTGSTEEATETEQADTEQAATETEAEQPAQDNSAQTTPAQQTTTATATTTTQATTTKTGDEGVIFFVAVALAGCVAIAFASKKRFVK